MEGCNLWGRGKKTQILYEDVVLRRSVLTSSIYVLSPSQFNYYILDDHTRLHQGAWCGPTLMKVCHADLLWIDASLFMQMRPIMLQTALEPTLTLKANEEPDSGPIENHHISLRPSSSKKMRLKLWRGWDSHELLMPKPIMSCWCPNLWARPERPSSSQEMRLKSWGGWDSHELLMPKHMSKAYVRGWLAELRMMRHNRLSASCPGLYIRRAIHHWLRIPLIRLPRQVDSSSGTCIRKTSYQLVWDRTGQDALLYYRGIVHPEGCTSVGPRWYASDRLALVSECPSGESYLSSSRMRRIRLPFQEMLYHRAAHPAAQRFMFGSAKGAV